MIAIAAEQRRLNLVTRSLALAAVVGLAAGVGAVAFHMLTEAVVHVALRQVVGYDQGGPPGEVRLLEHVTAVFRPWMLLVVPTIGGLISGYLVYRFAPEAEGHGTDAAIDAYHNKRGHIPPAVPIVKMFASAITIGTGGSGGREGPIAQIGAGFGSYLSARLGLSDPERRVLLAAGLGAGIGAIFQAPLAGAIFAVEVLYRDPDFESEALISAFIATVVAYCTFNVVMAVLTSVVGMPFEGFVQLFDVAAGIRFRDPLLLLPLTGLVVVMVAASWLYVHTFYRVQAIFKRLAIRSWIKPGLGAMGAGSIALMLYYSVHVMGEAGMWNGQTEAASHDVLSVLSFGYGFLQKIISAPHGGGLLIGILLAVGLGKIFTTALTIGSGGSGGVFGPSMVIGGSLGAVVGLAFGYAMPGVVTRIDVFVILGMAGFFAAAAKTPVSTLIMVSEITGSYELLLPSMWVCALAYVFSRGWSIYKEQVPTRIDSPAHRGDFIIDIIQGLTVKDALHGDAKRFTTVPLQTPLSDVVQMITGTKQSCFPVVDNDGHFYGLFSLNDVRQFLYEQELGGLAVAQDLAETGDLTLPLDLDLGSAIERFASGRFEELPVVDPDEPDHMVGMLRRRDVIAAYNTRLLHMRRLGEAVERPGG